MTKKRFFVIALLFLFILSLAACGGNEATKPESTTTSENVTGETKETEETKPADKQVLNIVLGTEPDSLDMVMVTDAYSLEVVNQFTEPLVTIEVENGKDVIKPAAAESWEVSDDGLVWTFHIRDNIFWEDGVPSTANDYAYGSRRIVDPETASPQSNNLRHIKNGEKIPLGEVPVDELGVKALDDKTLEVTLEYSIPYFLDTVISVLVKLFCNTTA